MTAFFNGILALKMHLILGKEQTDTDWFMKLLINPI